MCNQATPLGGCACDYQRAPDDFPPPVDDPATVAQLRDEITELRARIETLEKGIPG